MSTWVTLLKRTHQGNTDLKGEPERIRQSMAMAEAMGIRVIGFWATAGEYDYVMVSEFPDNAIGAAAALEIAKEGNSTVLPMPALSLEEFTQIVGQLP